MKIPVKCRLIKVLEWFLILTVLFLQSDSDSACRIRILKAHQNGSESFVMLSVTTEPLLLFKSECCCEKGLSALRTVWVCMASDPGKKKWQRARWVTLREDSKQSSAI